MKDCRQADSDILHHIRHTTTTFPYPTQILDSREDDISSIVLLAVKLLMNSSFGQKIVILNASLSLDCESEMRDTEQFYRDVLLRA